jgi:hypothetical protein
VEAVATRLLAWQSSGSLLLPVDCSPVSEEAESRFERGRKRVVSGAQRCSYGEFGSCSHSELTTGFGRCNLQAPKRAIYFRADGVRSTLFTALSLGNSWGFLRFGRSYTPPLIK